MFQVSRVGSHQNFNILGGPNWILSCCIHKVKQTIVHMIHMILSRSVHQITYGDVLKAFCKKPPCKGHLRVMDTTARPKGVLYSEVSL